MRIVLIIIVFLSFRVVASEKDWVCEEAGLHRVGNIFYSCGMGSGNSEEIARSNSLDSAIREFTQICRISSDCQGHKTSVNPQRMSCKVTAYNQFLGSTYSCYRMIIVSVED